MEEALVALLLGNAAVAAKIGARIWLGRAPQADAGKPYAVLQRVSGFRDYHMQGASGYVESRVQVDIYGISYGSTKTAARALIGALSGFRGTAGAVIIQGIFIDSERDLPAADAGEVTQLFRTSIDIFVHHSE